MNKLFLILLSFVSIAAHAEDYNVTKSIKQLPLNLANVTVTEASRAFTAGNPMSDILTLNIAADYDSGYGWITEAILQETDAGGSMFDASESATLQMRGIAKSYDAPVIRLGDGGAVGGSDGKLSVSVKVKPGGWSRATAHQWIYKILSGRDNQVVKTITINLDIATGWTYTVN